MEQAEVGVANLREHVDALLVIPNERLKSISGRRSPCKTPSPLRMKSSNRVCRASLT